MKVLLDCDGILGDFASEVVRFCNLHGGGAGNLYKVDEVYSFDILEALGCADLQDDLDLHMFQTDFCRKMPVYPGAVAFVDRLRSLQHEIVVVTSPYKAVKGWEDARRDWLWRNFTIHADDVIFAKRKECTSGWGDTLVDDKAENLFGFRSRGILFDRPWNRNHNGPFRAYSYEDVLARIQWIDKE